MGRFIIFSAGFLLILVQLAQSVDINGSSIVKTGNDQADETSALLVDALIAADQQDNNKFNYFPDAKSAHLFNLLNNAGDKRNPSIYSFGLGKRTSSRSNTLNPYSFGLGKRSGRNNAPNPYSFGLGKRAGSMYSFGLGKRTNPGSMYAFGLGKRPDSASRFGFGLGKRNSLEEESGQWMDEEYSQQPEDETEEEEEEEDNSEELSVNKRTPKMAFFPSHLRSAFFGGPQQMPSLAMANRRPNIGQIKLHTVYPQSNDLPNPGKRLPVYNFGLGK